MLIFSISFAVNAGGCTDCWSYANSHESDGGYAAWEAAYDYCIKNLTPCAEQLEPVVIKK